MTLQELERNLSRKPSKLFLLDGIGALLSLIMLAVVLRRIPFHGLSANILMVLSIVPALIVPYDLFCYFNRRVNSRLLISVIVAVNLAYCLLSIGMLWSHRFDLTLLGGIYFSFEILLILTLSWVEWRVRHLLQP